MDKKKRSRYQVLVRSIASIIIIIFFTIEKSVNTRTSWASQTGGVLPKGLIGLLTGSVFHKLSTGQSSALRVWNSYVSGLLRGEILDAEGLLSKQKVHFYRTRSYEEKKYHP
jgi:hypothetical protein